VALDVDKMELDGVAAIDAVVVDVELLLEGDHRVIEQTLLDQRLRGVEPALGLSA
jgi:hypothetical protein